MSSLINYNLEKLLFCHFMLFKPSQQGYAWKIKKCIKLFYKIIISDYTLSGYYNKYTILYADRFLSLRSDIRETLNNLCRTFSNKLDRLEWKKRYSISLHRILRNLKIIWSMKYLVKQYSLSEFIYALILFVEFKDIENELDKKVDISKYKLCFCYWDADPYQNFIIQYAKNHGCRTATLQHGIMLAHRDNTENNPDFAGIEFRSFVSDEFLIWNEFTKNEAIKEGIPENRLKVLGVVKCIGKIKPLPNTSSNIIGIILDGEYERQNNLPMLLIVQEWAKENQMKCIVRYHPHFVGNEYDGDLIEDLTVVCDKKVTLNDFLNKVSFCVVANSTVLFELEYFNFPFIRYTCGTIADKFKDYPSLSFSTKATFGESYNQMLIKEKKELIDAEIMYGNYFKQFTD